MEKGHTCDIGKDGPSLHTWPYREEVIAFEDTIIVSDEVPPAPQCDGKSFTLWTEAHEQNQLIVNNKRRESTYYLQKLKSANGIYSACPTDTFLLGSYNVSKA